MIPSRKHVVRLHVGIATETAENFMAYGGFFFFFLVTKKLGVRFDPCGCSSLALGSVN